MFRFLSLCLITFTMQAEAKQRYLCETFCVSTSIETDPHTGYYQYFDHKSWPIMTEDPVDGFKTLERTCEVIKDGRRGQLLSDFKLVKYQVDLGTFITQYRKPRVSEICRPF